TAIPPGEAGACPTACDDGVACTADALLDAGTCDARCSFTPITACAAAGDGCCPEFCNARIGHALYDGDCPAVCGNGIWEEPDELCDPYVHPSLPGDCPDFCHDGDACTVDLLNHAGTCLAECSFTPIVACANDDGCCAPGCDAATDTDCRLVWYEMYVEDAGEFTRFSSVWGSGPADTYAVAGSTIFHYDGSAWTHVIRSTQMSDAAGVWAAGPHDAFVVGTRRSGTAYVGSAIHNTGSGWVSMALPTTHYLTHVWGSAPDDVFAVGQGGLIVRYDGNLAGTWSEMTSGAILYLYAVWGVSASDVIAVGQSGTILHYDGNAAGTWTEMTAPSSVSSAPLRAVWGSASDDVFAVGPYGGVILHYDGTDWSEMTPVGGGYLYGVWGTAPDDVFAVGEDGRIVHYDGSWSPMEIPVTAGTPDLYSVWGTACDNVFAVGSEGTILHYVKSQYAKRGCDNTLPPYDFVPHGTVQERVRYDWSGSICYGELQKRVCLDGAWTGWTPNNFTLTSC
ncbi:MAG: hypothetical protein JXB32_03870, partial [Deltaproteobacteria bacterium]|nr:hypothetical protein [Deltaproteobacteria bacterium]